MALPVQAVRYPTELTGQDNGKLPASVLATTPGLAGGLPVELTRTATRAWRALSTAAKQDGHTLKLSGLGCAYRDYATQERIFLERYTPTNNGSTGRWWRGSWWYKRPGVAAAAIPGTSNHGWGLAVDIGEERDGDTGVESLDTSTLNWLIANAYNFGFSAELQSEPWHWRYYTGDNIPAAVLAHESTEDDLDATERQWLRDTRVEVAALYTLVRALVPEIPRKVNTATGELDANGVPTALIWRWTRELATGEGVDAEAIAAAIPEGLAARVADELAKRLAQ